MRIFPAIVVGALCAGLVSGLLSGCGRDKTGTNATGAPSKHQHIPPHGGTPVVLGHEEYHIELVLDASTGTMVAYVMDGELEDFVRVTPASFVVNVKGLDGPKVLTFNAVPNRATGETVGDTSQFTAQADWLKTTKSFDAVLQQITVKGTVYQNVAFNFPKGNDTDE